MMKILDNKRGDVNWIIVMMIIALLVMAIILFIFRDKMASVRSGLDIASCCENQGGTPSASICNTETHLITNLKSCEKSKEKMQYCCIPKSK